MRQVDIDSLASFYASYSALIRIQPSLMPRLISCKSLLRLCTLTTFTGELIKYKGRSIYPYEMKFCKKLVTWLTSHSLLFLSP